MIRGSKFGREMTLFSFPKCSELLWVPSNLIFNGYHHYVSGAKWPECEVDPSHYTEPRLRMSGSINLLPPYACMR